MSPRFLSFLPIAVFGLIGATSNGVAQELPFTVEFHDTTGYVMPMNVVDLKAWVRNISPGEVPIRLARTQNLLPTSNWFSAMCWGQLCYEPTLDVAPPNILAPGDSSLFKLTVGVADSFPRADEVAIVTVQFDQGMFTGGVTQTLSVRIDPRAGVEIEPVELGASAWPNPASGAVSIPVPAAALMADHVDLIDASGRIVAQLAPIRRASDHVDVDLGGVAVGDYFYRVSVGGRGYIGRVAVAR